MDKYPKSVNKCPKCMKTTLEFDSKTGKFRCSNCGFETSVDMMK